MTHQESVDTAVAIGPLVPAAIRERVDEIVAAMTLEEKAALTVGRDLWSTLPVERFGVPSIALADGPTGVRKAREGAIGIGDSIPATCFPTASALASSWDVELAREVGQTIGREAQALDVQLVLGPGVNLKRSPLAGRNFEYLSEDPVLAGAMAAAIINGIQEQGVGATIKHFVANEQETGRMYTDSIVDERTLREVYLRPFEIAVRNAHPWSVMCAYNLLNGTYCAEHRRLLHDILRDEWGFDGIVMSDWGAVNDRPAGIAAGLHLQMPAAQTVPSVIAAVESGDLPEDRLDAVVTELLGIILLAKESRRADTTADFDAHHILARLVAAESIVLLKNDGDILPIEPATGISVALIGEFARTPRYQGAGSSEVVPTRVETLLEQLPLALGPSATVRFAAGHGPDGITDTDRLEEARTLAASSDVAVVVVGLPGSMETEGRDRTHMDLPQGHNDLVEAVVEAQPNTVVVLVNGAPVAMPWADRVPALIEAWLGGQAAGGAIADVLTGAVNPSGKLSETIPVRLEDTPSFLSFPTAGDGTVRFTEGVFTGHRWYDARQIAPRFPFGHGLSYTEFTCHGLQIDSGRFATEDVLEVAVTVENTGPVAGKEVVQVYVGETSPRLPRPERELRAFAKVALEPGEATPLQFTLGWRDFAFYDVQAASWVMDPGEYEIVIGASAADLRVSARVSLPSSHAIPVRVDRNTPLAKALEHPATRPIVQPLVDGMVKMLGGDPDNIIVMFMMDMPLRKFVAMGAIDEAFLTTIEEATAAPQ